MATAKPGVSRCDTHLDCPICLEILKSPRTLPCQHTFCEECLSTFIISVQDTPVEARSFGFPCPSCRADVKLPGTYSIENADYWDKLFPVDKDIEKQLEKISMIEPNVNCQTCIKKGKYPNEATVWCKKCCVLLCRDCEAVHDVLLAGHTKVASDKYWNARPLVVEQANKCQKHDIHMDYFCCEHSEMLCAKCLTISHRQCVNVVESTDYIQDQMNTLQITDELDVLSTMFRETTMDKLQTRSKFKLYDLELQKSGLEWEISERRKRINHILDEMDAKSLADVNQCVQQQQNDIKEDIVGMEQLRLNVQRFTRRTKSTLTAGSDAIVISVLSTFDRDVKHLNKDKNTCYSKARGRVEVKMNFPKCLEKILQDGSDRSISLNIERPNAIRNRGFEYRLQRNVRLSDDQSLCCISGIDVLSNGCVIICDKYNGKVKYFNLKISTDIKLGLDIGNVFDVCKLDKNKIGISQPLEQKLLIVKVDDDAMTIVDTIGVGECCYGLDHADGKVFTACPDGARSVIKQIDIENGSVELTMASRRFTKKMWYLRVNRDKHLVASLGTNAFLVMNPKTQAILKVMLHRVPSAGFGIAFDASSNFFVCSPDDGTVTQHEYGGQKHKVRRVLGKADGLRTPLAVAAWENILLVTQRSNDNMQLYWL